MLKKGDIILVVSVLAVFLLMLAGSRIYKKGNDEGHKVLIIKQDENVVDKIDLDTVVEPVHVKIKGSYNNVILVEKGRACFETADCPDGVCVRTGWISQKGDTAVCLPNRAIIKIEGQSAKVDGVAF